MKINLYAHSGSDNHGCEALAVSISCLLNNNEIILFSANKASDLYYGVNNYCKVESQGYKIKPYSFYHIFSKILSIFNRNLNLFYNKTYKNVLDSNGVFLQIGGDNYCYGKSYVMLDYLNNKIKQNNGISILFGASIDSKIIDMDYNNLKMYDLIIARESITFNNLKKYLPEEKIRLYPDPAFILPASIDFKIPDYCYGAVGINISPMILDYAHDKNIVINNYKHLISYILTKTNKNIILVPHVINENTDDREVIKILYREFCSNTRINIVHDCTCTELKSIISKCSTFIGARTHSTIAAYSSYVPTLVVGYSVKSKGIALDLFGTYENYVIPVDSLIEANQLCNSYQWIETHRNEIINTLKVKIPQYEKRLTKLNDELNSLFN